VATDASEINETVSARKIPVPSPALSSPAAQNPVFRAVQPFIDSASQTVIIANAARLLKDAKLLVDHERYTSASALSVFGARTDWQVCSGPVGQPEEPPKLNKLNKRSSAHVKKQAAVSSLLLVESVTNKLGEAIISGPIDEELIERVARFAC
jgi:hypothetical protein